MCNIFWIRVVVRACGYLRSIKVIKNLITKHKDKNVNQMKPSDKLDIEVGLTMTSVTWDSILGNLHFSHLETSIHVLCPLLEHHEIFYVW